jgi:hypothetical protein
MILVFFLISVDSFPPPCFLLLDLSRSITDWDSDTMLVQSESKFSTCPVWIKSKLMNCTLHYFKYAQFNSLYKTAV